MPNDKELLSEIQERVETFARERGYGFSESKDKLLKSLVAMHKKFGDFYCPCQVQKVEDTICVCKSTREGYVDKEETCICHFFVRE